MSAFSRGAGRGALRALSAGMKDVTPPASASQPLARIALRRLAVRRGSESFLRRAPRVEPSANRSDADAAGRSSESSEDAAPSIR